MTDRVLPKDIESVLELARWAPSGDNAQPWSFCLKGERDVEVLIRRSPGNVYEYRDGEPTLISAGALLENIKLAAPLFGLAAVWHYAGSKNGIDHVDVHFTADTSCVSDLLGQITRRSVDRRAYRIRALTAEQKNSLSGSLTPVVKIGWYDSLSDRCRIAALTAQATIIRLTIPETFGIHKRIVDWKNRESEDGIPSQALGLDPVTLRLTRWALAKWSRTELMNTFGAPFMASLQMDLLPGVFCASYFVIRLQKRTGERGGALVQTLEAGQAIQRFWLRATELGLVIQPCLAMLAFWSYAAAGQEFTTLEKARAAAKRLANGTDSMFGKGDNIVFVGRIGWPRSKSNSRSTRLPLARLLGWE